MLKRHQIMLGFAYAALACLLIAMCACMGCSTSKPLALSGYAQYRGTSCELCERTTEIQWAHELPQSLFKAFINDPDNGHTLCRDCHVFFHFQKTGVYWSDDMDRIVELMKASRCSMKDGKKAAYEVKQ